MKQFQKPKMKVTMPVTFKKNQSCCSRRALRLETKNTPTQILTPTFVPFHISQMRGIQKVFREEVEALKALIKNYQDRN